MLLQEKVMQAKQFVEQVRLPEYQETALKAEPLKALQTDNDGAVVDGKSVMCFVGALGPQNKSDVLNSTLFAQLVASAKYPTSDTTTAYNVVGWYNSYIDTLKKLGWTFQDLSFSDYHASGSTFEVSKVVVELLIGIAGNSSGLLVDAALNALNAEKASQNSKACSLWSKHTDEDSNGSFQLGYCTEESGSVAMALGAFYMMDRHTNTSVLFTSYSSSETKLETATSAAVLNPDVYGQVRDTVINKLGQRANIYIADLDLGDL